MPPRFLWYIQGYEVAALGPLTLALGAQYARRLAVQFVGHGEKEMQKIVAKSIAAVIMSFSLSAYAGVADISKYGTSSTGEQIYKITCTNGVTMRYYWRNGEWYRAGLGVAGMSSYSISDLAEKRCR